MRAVCVSVVLTTRGDGNEPEATLILPEYLRGDFLGVWGLDDYAFWRGTYVAEEGGQSETEDNTDDETTGFGLKGV